MTRASPPIVAFNAGELSPRLDGRTDLDKYAKGCRTLENFIPLVQGGAQKRSGFRFAGFGDNAARLIPFSFNSSDSYVISVGAAGIWFFRNGQQVFDSVKTITGATKANPAVITSVAHGFLDGDIVFVQGVVGMTELNNRFKAVQNVTANTFELNGVDSTSYGTYTSGGTASRVYIISSPYNGTDIQQLQFAGQNDVLYIACPTKPPHKLSRFSNTNWTIAPVAFKHVPFSPENLDDSSFVSTVGTSSSIELTSSAGVFTSSMVGSYIKQREIPEAFAPEWKAKETLDGAEYRAFQANGSTFEIGDRIQFEGRVYSAARVPATAKTGTAPPVHDSGFASDGDSDWKFVNFGYGYSKITAFTDAYRVSASVVETLPLSVVSFPQNVNTVSTANPIVMTFSSAHNWETGDKVFFREFSGTFGALLNNTLRTITRTGTTTLTVPLNGAGLAGIAGVGFRMDVGPNLNGTSGKIYPSLFRWSFAAWDAVRGYPRAVLFFEDRLIWAGTDANPQTCWASRTGRYEDHATFDEDDSALVFTLSAADPIEWLAEQNSLVIGTSGDEFSSDRNAAAPLAPGTVNTIRRRSQYGSRSGVAPRPVENVLLFAQRAGRKLRELVFDESQGGLVAPDMTRLADHITLGLIKEMAFQSEPNRILWVVLEDGQLLGFTYERDEQVTGWHRHPIGGTGAKVLSIAVIPHPDGDGDQLWALVQRTISGSSIYSVEYLEKQWTRDMALEDACCLDSATTYDGAPVTVISGLFRLAGETVWALADGVAVGPFTVSAAGKITLATAASVVQVGLLYSATLSPMRLEAGAADGTAQGKTKRISTVVVRLDQTGRGLYIGDTPARATQEIVLPDGALTDGDTALVPFPGRYDFGGLIALVHSRPTPATITAIWPQLVTMDR